MGGVRSSLVIIWHYRASILVNERTTCVHALCFAAFFTKELFVLRVPSSAFFWLAQHAVIVWV